MSRVMLISCGIQWLAQVARYFSQAHLYLNGTSWFTSVWPLMMRLSATFTRRVLLATTELAAVAAEAADASERKGWRPQQPLPFEEATGSRPQAEFGFRRGTLSRFGGTNVVFPDQHGVFPMGRIIGCCVGTPALLDRCTTAMLQHCIAMQQCSRPRAPRTRHGARACRHRRPRACRDSLAGLAARVVDRAELDVGGRRSLGHRGLACAAAASIADRPPAPPAIGTAFSEPAEMVDFSACVAPMVRR
jgi:hypothetical protein